ncbi:hypothetical protein ACFLRA_01765 [Bdellovibrionota bacterium]
MKKERKNILLNNEGAILLLTVILVFFVTVVGVTFISWRYTEGVDTTNIMLETKTLTIAESGLWESVYYLNNIDPSWLGDSPTNHPIKIGSDTIGEYRVTVIDLGDNDREIQITAYVPSASNAVSTKTIHVSGTLTGQSSEGIHELFLYGLWNGGGNGLPFTFDGNYTSEPIQDNTFPSPANNMIDGDLYSNVGLAFKNGSAQVVKDTARTSAPSITVENWTGSYAGAVETDAELVEVPVLDSVAEARLKHYAEVQYSGNTTLSGTIDLGDHLTDDGDIFVDGDLNLEGNFDGNGYVVATGNINITGNIVGLNPQTVVNVIAFGNVVYSGASNVGIQVPLYANHEFQILTNAHFDMTKGSAGAGYGFKVDPDADVSIKWNSKLADEESNPNALGQALGIDAAGIGGGAAFSLANGYWEEVD